MLISTNEKHWWKYNWRENRSTRRKTCPIVKHSVHHKSHKEFHGIEPGRPRWQNLTQNATTMPRLRTFNSFATRSVLRRAVNQLTGPSFFVLLYTQSHLSSNDLDLPFSAFPLRSIGFIVPNNKQPVRPGSQCMLLANVRQDRLMPYIMTIPMILIFVPHLLSDDFFHWDDQVPWIQKKTWSITRFLYGKHS